MKVFVRYFVRGLLFILPIFVTGYIIFFLLNLFDRLIPTFFNIELPPGVGLLLVITFVTLTGFVTSFFLVKPAFSFLESYVYKIPFINIIYSSSKDVVGAIVGDKKRFDHPVMVKSGKQNDMFRLGFVTRDEINVKGLENTVAVYFPHSYNISGNILLVARDQVIFLNISGSEAMKFIVSAGMTGTMEEK